MVPCFSLDQDLFTIEKEKVWSPIRLLAILLSRVSFSLLMMWRKYFVVGMIISHIKGYLPSSASVARFSDVVLMPTVCLQNFECRFSILNRIVCRQFL